MEHGTSLFLYLLFYDLSAGVIPGLMKSSNYSHIYGGPCGRYLQAAVTMMPLVVKRLQTCMPNDTAEVGEAVRG